MNQLYKDTDIKSAKVKELFVSVPEEISEEKVDFIGNIPSGPYLAIIGSRNPTEYGKNACKYIVKALSGYNLTIVSGLANGIDQIAIKTALENKINVIAIPGSGINIDVLYPRSSLPIVKTLIKHYSCCLLSPFKQNQKVAKHLFQKRNSVISAISDYILIIEGGLKSGTAMTVNIALKYGKDIFCVPNNIFCHLNLTNHLIKDGAEIIISDKDLIERMGLKKINGENEKLNLELDLSENQKNFLLCIRNEARSLEDICRKININVKEAKTIQTELEIRGLIIESNGILNPTTV